MQLLSITEKYKLKAILANNIINAMASYVSVKNEGKYLLKPSFLVASGVSFESLLLIKRPNSRDNIDKEKNDVKPQGEKMINGRFYTAKSINNALAIKPPYIPLLYVSLPTCILPWTKLIGPCNLSCTFYLALYA